MICKTCNMNKILLICLSLLLIAGVSCKKFLATTPTDFLTPETYYETEQQLNAALTGVYDALGQDGTFSRYLVTELMFATDEAYYNRDASTPVPQLYNHSSSDSRVYGSWRQLYIGINRANLLLENINKPKMDEAKRKVMRGEALFLRAFMYFQLVNIWGDVPLRLKSSTAADPVSFPRTPASVVMQQIVNDMTEAEGLVKGIADWGFTGRVSKTAVEAVLARVYLKWAGQPFNDRTKYENVKYWTAKVIGSGQHALNTDFSQVFINESSDKYDIKECIWEIEFGPRSGSTTEGGWWSVLFAIQDDNTDNGYGYGYFTATGYLYKLYDDTKDVRCNWTISPYKFKSNSGPVKENYASTAIYNRYIGKWRREYEAVLPRSKNWAPTNFPVMRYADVLLMYAEADNELRGVTDSAITCLNLVRARARAYEYKGTHIIKSQEELRNVLRDERARELAFEGLRKFDLIRWGIFLERMKDVGIDQRLNGPSYSSRGYDNVSQRDLLQPIPSIEMTLNRQMKQNPGW